MLGFSERDRRSAVKKTALRRFERTRIPEMKTGLEDALCHHGVSHALEACNVRTCYKIIAQAILLRSADARRVNRIHDLTQLPVDLLSLIHI